MVKRAAEGLEEPIFEVLTWRQARGPAGAVMCETRDLGIQWPQRHTLLLEGQVAVDMRVVCPQDEEDASDTSQDGLLEEMGSPNTRSLAGANSRLRCEGRPATCGQISTAM